MRYCRPLSNEGHLCAVNRIDSIQRYDAEAAHKDSSLEQFVLRLELVEVRNARLRFIFEL